MSTVSIPAIGMRVKGRYQVQRIKANNGQIIQSSPWTNNLITDAGKRVYISSARNIPLTLAVGTGNSAPHASNLALDNAIYRTSAAGSEALPSVFTEDGGTLKSLYRFRFYPGQATGNISELGIYLGLPGYPDFTLFSRALVRDSHGNPTTITVLSDEYLDVYWEITLEVAGRTTGTFPLYNKDGTTNTLDWVMKPAAAHWWSVRHDSNYLAQPQISPYGYYTCLSNSITTEPGYNDEDPPGMTGWHAPNNGAALPYVDGSYYRDYEYTWLLDRANVSGINCFRLYIGPGHLWIYLPNHSIDKTHMDTLTIRFRLSIA